jgi:phosphoribosylaminoimidazole-succinocarboxamide synthase
MSLEKDGKIVLIDEIHTPDSSRYFYAEGYQERQKKVSHKSNCRRSLFANG